MHESAEIELPKCDTEQPDSKNAEAKLSFAAPDHGGAGDFNSGQIESGADSSSGVTNGAEQTSTVPFEPTVSRASTARWFIILSLMGFLVLAAVAQFDSVERPVKGSGVAGGPVLRLDINRAGEREWALMPGVGPVLARRIVHERTSNGAFQDVDDLDRVHGIGEKTLQQIRPFCEPQNSPSSKD